MYTTSKYSNLPGSNLAGQPSTLGSTGLGSSNYRKFQHRRIHTEVDEPASTHTQVASKYQPYQFQQSGYKKDYSNTKLQPYNPYTHINPAHNNNPTANSNTNNNQSSQKASSSSQSSQLAATNAPVKQPPTGTGAKNYKYLVKPSTLGTKYLKTEPDAEDSTSYRNRNNNGKTGTQVYNNKYEIEGVAGKGTFGVVYFGKNLLTGKRVALKKVLQDKKYKNRELEILKEVKHSNILEMRDFFLTAQGSEQYLNVVMDYYSDNLYQIIKKKQMNPLLIKLYTYQVLRGLNYLTMLSIAHRDIKPQNILVDRNTHKVVICDFGSAKRLIKGQPNIAYICSRCYRAPQLIFGATEYTTQIDMWSLGCVVVQMINGEAPFLGDSQIDQLLEIIKILGTPQKADIEEMNPKYDLKEYKKFPNIKSVSWAKILKTDDALLVDLVTKILEYSPKRRFTAAQALNHPYFDELKQLSQSSEAKDLEYLKKMRIKELPELYDFTPDQLLNLGIKSPQKFIHLKKQKQSFKESEPEPKPRPTTQKNPRAESSMGFGSGSLLTKPTSNLIHLKNNSNYKEEHPKQQTDDFTIKEDEIKLDRSAMTGYGTGSSKLVPKRIPVSGLINSGNLTVNTGSSGQSGLTGASSSGTNHIRNLSNRFEYR